MARFPLWFAILAILAGWNPAIADEPAVDLHGDPLPPSAIARLGTLRFRLPNETIEHLAFSPDGKRLLAHSNLSITVWNAESGQKQIDFATRNLKSRELDTRFIGPSAWRADGRGIMLVQERDNGAIRFGDFTRDVAYPPKRSGDKPNADAALNDEPIGVCAISPNGQYFLAERPANGDRSLAVAVWASEPGKRLSQLRLLRVLGPQQRTCRQIIFSPDSQYAGVFSGPAFDQDQTVPKTLSFALYELATGKERDRRDIPTPLVFRRQMTAALAPDGRYLAVGGSDNLCHVYELGRTTPEITFGTAEKLTPSSWGWSAIAFSGDRIFAANTRDRRLHVHEISTGKALRPAIEIAGGILAIAHSPDGRRIAIADQEGDLGIIRLWDVETGREIEPAPGHINRVHHVEVVADGTHAVTWEQEGSDCFPRLWELETGKEVRRFEIPGKWGRVALAPDKKTILARIDDKLLAIDVATGVARPAPGEMSQATGNCQIQAGDGRSVVVCDRQFVNVWDWPEGRLRQKLELSEKDSPWAACLSPDGELLIALKFTGPIDVWKMKSGVHQLRLPELTHSNHLGTGFFGSGQPAALLRTDPTATERGARTAFDRETPRFGVWDLQSGKFLRSFESPKSNVTFVIAADPGGYVFATAEAGGEGSPLLYETATGLIRKRLFDPDGASIFVAFSPDGNRLVSAGLDSTALVWDVSFTAAARGRKPASDADLEIAWKTLAQANAVEGYDALLTFTSAADRAVALLRSRLRAPPGIGAAELDRLIGELASESFAKRAKASDELEKRGRPLLAELHARLAKIDTLEAKRRLTALLERLDTGVLFPEELRAVRSMEFLERIGAPAAQALIADLAKGEPTADLTVRAIAAKGRLDRRKN